MASDRARRFAGADVTIARLRGWFPQWEWRAERLGFGWMYIGVCLWEEVRVYACSVMVGEDTFETQWRVDNGAASVDFSTWSMTYV